MHKVKTNQITSSQPLRIKISFKLFGAFFLILLIVAGVLLLSRVFLARNMKVFIGEMETARIIRIASMVENEYEVRNGWQGIIGNRAFIDRLSLQERKAWKRFGILRDMGHTQEVPAQWPMDIFLLDADRRPIVGVPGNSDEEYLRRIEVGGKTVGWIGRHPEPFIGGVATDLIEGQNRELYFLYLAAILLTAGIAFFLSRHFLEPIHKLIEGTKQLTSRNFSARIEAVTKDELGQLAAHFNAMAQTLESYESTHRLWLTDISHDLRTPLTILKAEIEALQDGIREVNSDSLASLHGEIARLGRLVEDLHLSFLMDSDSLQFNMQIINPFAVMKTITEGYDRLLRRRQIDLLLEIEDISNVSMEGDAGRLIQVFTNIFDNACHYIQAPGVLKVRGREEASFFTLLFQDSGPGVGQDAYPRLFDRNFRADAARSRKNGGSGLGLFICRRIIEHHGGGIWAEKSPLGGLTIGIRLPVL